MKKLYYNYLSTFKGLSKEVWWLAFITFINRSGTMVIPFLSLYLTESLDYTLENVGWIMSAFGVGSVLGSWIGGKLTDKYGFYRVMYLSLALTGILFIGLQFIEGFYAFCFAIFLVMLVADAFRPAMFVAMNTYSKAENKTRSVTLIRLAINLGFSAGPAIGGFIITSINYKGLFWMDGITCLLATLVLINVLHPKKARVIDEQKVENPQPIRSDGLFWIFFVAMFIFGFVFLQYFSTMPLYYRDVHALTEFDIGLLLGMNGFLIFVFEMPLIKWLGDWKYSKELLITIGLLVTGLSYVVLLMTPWVGILIIGMLFMTFGEMIAFPFSNSFVIERSKRGKQGEYMAFYSISFSAAHIFGHNSGLQMVDKFGYDTTWMVISIMSAIGVLTLFYLMYRLKREKSDLELKSSEI
ncbi:MAG: MDR family MFS transporter [Polaribacter sp.]